MKNSYVKMNDNNYHLSLGNFFRLVKEISNIKTSALQTELFCTIFCVDSINVTTVNNYCTGYRSINDSYKQIYLSFRKKYEKDRTALKSILTGLISIIEGTVIKCDDFHILVDLIDKSNKIHKLCFSLYSIAKNDISVDENFQYKLKKYINENNLYDFICEILFFVIIVKKQPLYERDELYESIDQVLENTTLSVKDISEFLKFSLNEGGWSIRGLKELAKNENPVACYQLGYLEFYGEITGNPRYIMAYKYFEIASRKDHPSANWMLGIIHSNNFINMKPNFDLAWYYFKKSEKLGCIAAINSIGNCYLTGTVPNEGKNIKKAIYYFEIAASRGYVYACNNLGIIYEKQEKYKKALEQFIKSANQGECWAANKVGEYYRKGIGSNVDFVKAFEYYNVAIESSLSEITPWAFYNLAKYFYQYGCKELYLEPDLDKTIELYKKASARGIAAADIELLNIYQK